MDAGVACEAREIRHAFKPGAGPLYGLEVSLRTKTGTEKIFAADDASPSLQSESLTIPFDAAAGQYRTPGQNLIEWMGKRGAAKP